MAYIYYKANADYVSSVMITLFQTLLLITKDLIHLKWSQNKVKNYLTRLMAYSYTWRTTGWEGVVKGVGKGALLLFAASAFAQSPMMPNPQLTPGAIRTSNAAEICAASFRTKPFRHTTQATKAQVYKEYNVEPNKGYCTGGCEVDHLIPLELGGLDDIKDLWPQPSQPKPAFHEKDKLENWLHKQVCSGNMNLVDAQIAISHNWYTAYVQMEMEVGHR